MNKVLTNNTKHLFLALMAQGVRHFVVSPGSRTTPLALLLAELAQLNAEVNVTVDVDERSAAFFALGLAKTQNQPVALLATSGTAVANYLPAIIEAKIAHIPLIILTTDRPQELQAIGAAQTIDQVKMYGNQVKEFVQITLQDEHPDVTEYIDYHVQQLVQQAITAPAGGVQINLPLRKPLMPDLGETWPVVNPQTLVNGVKIPDKAIIAEIKSLLLTKNVLILAGPTESNLVQKAEQLQELAQKYQIPILADVLSGLRPSEFAINGIDVLLEANVISDELLPDLVIRLGATPVSARVNGWLKQHNIAVIQIGENFSGHDYTRHAKSTINCDESMLMTILLATDEQRQRHDFVKQWLAIKSKLNQVVVQAPFSEATLPRALNILPYGAELFIANSMPIRDMDNYFVPQNPVRAYANRGANGIDGTVSSAFGMAMSANPAYLLTGDLTLFHDMNGLMLSKQANLSLTIIVVNNNGGGIFSFLPQATAKAYFEPMFGTPLNLSIQKIAMLYDASYVLAEDEKTLAMHIKNPVSGLKIIEVKSDRNKNVVDHQELIAQIKEAFDAKNN